MALIEVEPENLEMDVEELFGIPLQNLILELNKQIEENSNSSQDQIDDNNM